MGYVLRVRLASFFAGAATASFVGMYILHKDYKVAHESLSQQDIYGKKQRTFDEQTMKKLHDSLDERISAMEKLKHVEASQHAEATE